MTIMGTSAAAQLAMLMTPAPGVKTEAMRIVTRCKSVDQFIALFHRFCNPTSCFIPSPETRAPGTETAFSIRLADGTVMLRGHCVVLEAWPTPGESPFKRSGVRIGIRKLSPESTPIFDRLLARAPAKVENVAEPAAPPSAPAAAPTAAPTDTPHEATLPTVIVAGDDAATPTVQMPPLVETRVAGSGLVLPANPLTELDDDALQAFVDCTVSEELEDSEPLDEALAIPDAPIGEGGDATVPTRAPIATLLGVAPLTAPRLDDWPLTIPRDAIKPLPTPRDDATPVPLPAEGTLPLVIAAREPAAVIRDAPRREIVVRGTRSPAGRSFARAVSTLSSEERWWMAAAIGVAVITLLAILMSSLASL